MGGPPAAAIPKPCYVCGAPDGKHCAKCKSRHYCSKACQLVDWKEGGHKEQCRQMTAAFQDRLLDELMPAKKVKEEPAIVEDVLLADGSKARLSAVPATTIVKASAPTDAPGWRGTCAICLDELPMDLGRQTFYFCCCTTICMECFNKCILYDERCPLCREPAPKSDAEVLRLLQKHVDKGNADAQVSLGFKYRDGSKGLKKSLKRAFQLYELAAAQGHAQGQFRLGSSYQLGNGVKINYKTAAQWYRRAAEQGYPIAELKLGMMFHEGKGVAQSHEEALKWFRLAAAQGFSGALYMLGLCCQHGLGVPEDLDEALRLFKRAAALGFAEAAAAITDLEAHRV